MADKYFKEQFDNEEVLLVFRKHPIVMRKALIISMAAWLVGPVYTLIMTYVHPNSPPSLGFFFGSLVVSILLGVVLMFPAWVRWHFSVYIMSNKRFIQQTKSFFSVSVVDIGLEQIQMINYEISGVQETLLGFGTIMVQTFVGDLVIHDVHHPAKLQKQMIHILRDLGIHASTRPGSDEAETTNDETEAVSDEA